jgi:hypothetical protein
LRPDFYEVKRHRLDATDAMFEILAANETAFVDSDGDVSDWIEIHNPTTTTTALTGWYLSDDPDFL